MTAFHDLLDRPLQSLRLSVTDRCNLRCSYCMPEQEYSWLPKRDILTFEELSRLAEVFVSLKCELCETHLSAREDQVGQLIECPDCGHTTLVRVPRKPQGKRVLPGMEMEARQPYELGEATPTPIAA